jgi:hypothetical protein
MTTSRIDMTTVTPVSAMAGEDAEDTQALKALATKATDFLSSFRWCTSVVESFVGLAVAGVIGVFLFRIRPAEPDVDEWLWVVVGDVPPAYLVVDDAPSPTAALEAYISEMQQWVDAVKAGAPTDELIPVNVPATREFADMLESRLQFLQQRVLKEFGDDSKL